MAKENMQNLDYVKSITDLFTKDELYFAYEKSLRKGKNEARIIHRQNIKKIDSKWVEVIEECLVSLDTIVRNPRKFIVIEEDIIDISLARSITTESVKHLAQHTNLISSVDEDGMVLPNKILNTSKEESYEVYENRFIYTLLIKLRDFVAKRFDIIKRAYLTGDELLEIAVDSAFSVGNKKMYYKQSLTAALPSKELAEGGGADISNLERVAKISRIISDFLSSPFAKQMVSSAPVRPPIQRTNVILKNHDFKKALMLWQFIETYDKMGVEIESKSDSTPLDNEVKKRFLEIQYLNKLLFDALTSDKELAEGVDIVIDNKLADIGSLLEEAGAKDTAMPKQAEDKEEEKEKGEEKPEEKEDKEGAIDKGAQKGVSEEEKQAQRTQDDDYPVIAFDVPEVINLYEKSEDAKSVKRSDIKRINLALDRAILQKKIEQTKKDKILREKLRRQRKKTEAKQKELAQKAKLAREKKAQREAAQKQRAIKREQEEKLKRERQQERARQAELRAEKQAILEEQKRLAQKKAEQQRRARERKEQKYKLMMEEKAAREKERLWEEEKSALKQAYRQAIADNLKVKENRANTLTRLKLENYKKQLNKEYELAVAQARDEAKNAAAKKLEAIETVLEEFVSNYGRGKKKS
jgi:hypothetical protein